MRLSSVLSTPWRAPTARTRVAVLVLVPAALAVAGGCGGLLGIDDPDVVTDGGGIDSNTDAQGADAALDASSDATLDATTDAGLDAVADSAGSGPPSCQVPGDGRTNCGVAGDASCCVTLPVTHSPSFLRDYDGTDAGSDAGNPAYITAFNLDKYEVTVGRFRQFVAAWVSGYRIDAGAGKHTATMNGESGLGMQLDGEAPIYESGWQLDWSNMLPDSGAGWDNEQLSSTVKAWTGGDDKKPMGYVTWYEAYAFCIWDGGYLPSEAEWDSAAQQGQQVGVGQRAYPWSVPPTSTVIDCNHANYAGGVDGGSCNEEGGPSDVGSYSAMDESDWGHDDLAGNLWEWTLDWYYPYYVNPCNDCAHVGDAGFPDASRVLRGGGYANPAESVRAVHRYSPTSLGPQDGYGFRCARPNN
jgi:formylglycine-generating enzyme required for sulfatase activity